MKNAFKAVLLLAVLAAPVAVRTAKASPGMPFPRQCGGWLLPCPKK